MLDKPTQRKLNAVNGESLSLRDHVHCMKCRRVSVALQMLYADVPDARYRLVSLLTPALLFSKVAFSLTPEKLKEMWTIPIG